MPSIGGIGGAPNLDPRQLSSHGKKLKALESQASKAQKLLDELAKCAPPSDPKLKAKWDNSLQKIGKSVSQLGKCNKGLSSNAKKAQKALQGDDGKKFKKAVFAPAQVVFQKTSKLGKSAQSSIKKLTGKAQASQQSNASDDKTAVGKAEATRLALQQLQQAMQTHQKAMQMMSNMSKAQHDTAMSLIGNLRV